MLLVCKAAKSVGWRFNRRPRRVSGTPTMNRRADALQMRALGAKVRRLCVRVMRGSTDLHLNWACQVKRQHLNLLGL